MDLLLSVLPADGGWMLFDDFIVAARGVNARVELWRRAKLQRLVETRIEGTYADSGVHQIRKVV